MYKKYTKYKHKYLSLKRQLARNIPYYFVHATSIENLKQILETGIIYPGKYLTEDQLRLSGESKSEYVYCHMYFDDLKNLPHSFGISLILHPNIACDNGFVFNKGWRVSPDDDSIVVTKNDANYADKITEIRQFIKNPDSLPEKVRQISFMDHEVLFDHPIMLTSDNVLGIMGLFDSIDLDSVREIVNRKHYNTRLYDNNYPFPVFDVHPQCYQ